MAKLSLTVNLDNDAMQDRYDVAYIIRNAAEAIEQGQESGGLYDINGNKVGTWLIK